MDLKQSEAKNSFRIFLHENLLLEHTPENPFLLFGKGTGSFKFCLGNFEIQNYVKEKRPLTSTEIHSSKSLTLSDSDHRTKFELEIECSNENSKILKIRFKNRSELEKTGINRVWIRIPAKNAEHVYGCGEQFSYFDLRGHEFPIWVREQGVGRNPKDPSGYLAGHKESTGDYHTTYCPLPTFVSSEKYFCHVETSGAYANFDFRSPEFHELEIWKVPDELVFGVADSMLDLVSGVSDYFGRQPLLPEWVYNGVILGIQGTQENLDEKLKIALDNGVKVSAIWIQDWCGQLNTSFGQRLIWNWAWNKSHHPHLNTYIKDLNQRGIKVLAYINPYIKKDESLFQEASKNGFLAKNLSGGDYLIDFDEFEGGVVDLTNPDAFQWYKGVIKRNMIDLGLSGWMLDFAEWNPTDIVYSNGISGELMHNQWPYLWAKCGYEAVAESGKLDKITFFMRAGYSGFQKYCPLMWAGDQNVDWPLDDGLASVIPAALSIGMCGHGLHHSDIGGYTAIPPIQGLIPHITFDGMKRSEELFLRWAEHSAFTPVMRTHEGNRPQENWQYFNSAPTATGLGKMSKVYTALKDYTRDAVKENHESGIPVMRPLFLHYESDKATYSLKYQYLFGRDMLIAPVFLPGQKSWKAYLPKDSWVHLWSGVSFEGAGKEVVVDAPIGQPPVFYRKNSKWAELFQKIGSQYGHSDE